MGRLKNQSVNFAHPCSLHLEPTRSTNSATTPKTITPSNPISMARNGDCVTKASRAGVAVGTGVAVCVGVGGLVAVALGEAVAVALGVAVLVAVLDAVAVVSKTPIDSGDWVWRAVGDAAGDGMTRGAVLAGAARVGTAAAAVVAAPLLCCSVAGALSGWPGAAVKAKPTAGTGAAAGLGPPGGLSNKMSAEITSKNNMVASAVTPCSA